MTKGRKQLALLLVIATAAITCLSLYRQFLSPEKIAAAEMQIRGLFESQPAIVLFVAFLIYTIATGLSLPIATLLSLSYAWLLGWSAIPVLSLGATCGATLAFWSARFLFRDWVQDRFADKLTVINRGFERDGAYYIVFLRMVAVFPYVVVNLVLGLVPVKSRTYFFATLLGMLPLNIAFVYLGRQIPSTTDFLDQGMKSLISWQLLLGIGIVGFLPLLIRALFKKFYPTASEQPQASHHSNAE